ncbi:MAG: bifunctional nuclease family protein, partial [Anaerolineales bacterium]|nr:bifunctional nuclease family protein [Anaerolineales bacterium]
SSQRVVILKQRDAERYLPIWVGPYEAEAIAVALQEIEMIRPLTQDLLKNVITTLNGVVLRVEVVALRDDIFYGNIVIEREGRIYNIDSRPSDAIALAVRAHVPIFVHRSVMEQAGITPEADIREQSPSMAAPSEIAQETLSGEVEEDRLDVFEDFLKKLTDKDFPESPTSPSGGS